MQEGFLEFVELPVFIRALAHANDPELLEAVQTELQKNPKAGDLLKGGLRKARVRSPRRGEGKRGGYRVWYYFSRPRNTIFLLFLLDKRKAQNISKGQEERLVAALKAALRPGD